MRGHAHDPAAGGLEVGNMLGDRSCVRQSRSFREYESGNNVKGLLGTGHLAWDVHKKQGAYEGATVYDAREQQPPQFLQQGEQRQQKPPQLQQPPQAQWQQQQQQPPPLWQQQQQWQQPPPPRQPLQAHQFSQSQLLQHQPLQPPTADTLLGFAQPNHGRRAPLQQSSAPPSAAPVDVQAASHGRRAQPQPKGLDANADALWQAVGNRDHEEVARLLSRGADPNMVCPDGWVRAECAPKGGAAIGRSVLHHAAWAGDLAIFKLLVQGGADVMRQRNTAWRPNGGVRGRGATPLHHAVMYNRIKIVDYLLTELGVPIDLAGEQGYTPLHLAAKFNYPSLVEYLLQRGARTDMLTRDEKTARDLAAPKQERSHEQMGDMLAMFDKYDAEAKHRKRLLPGAPLPPDPRLNSHAAAAPPPPPPSMFGGGVVSGGGGGGVPAVPPPQPRAETYAPVVGGVGRPPSGRAARPMLRSSPEAPRGGALGGLAGGPQHGDDDRMRRRQPPPVHAAPPSSALRPDQEADAAAASIRARGRGSGPLW